MDNKEIIEKILNEHTEYLKQDLEDGKSNIELELTQDEIDCFALAAHQRGLSLNEFITQVLEAFIDVAEEEFDDE
jgi:uncharacterized protein (DUF1778 family)